MMLFAVLSVHSTCYSESYPFSEFNQCQLESSNSSNNHTEDLFCNLHLISFVPCTPTHFYDNCDIFVYPAMLLAMESINYGNIRLSNGIEDRELRVKIKINEIATKVSNNDDSYCICGTQSCT